MQSKLWLSHWRFVSISVLLLFVGPLLVLGQQEEAKQSQISEEEAIGALTFFVFTVAIGVLVGSVIRFLHLPYTAILIVIGASLGILFQRYPNQKLIGPGANTWMDINPDLFLSVFLPVLLFSAAFVLEWHFVRKLLFEALLLAGPGVVFSGGLTGVLVYYTFPYQWSWVQCFLFGGVLSATDPVAVAAILSEAALPSKLQTLVNLEALLNDGAAFVAYTILRGFAEERHDSVGQVFGEFFHLAVAGLAIGLGFGMVTSLFLYIMYQKKIEEMMLTIAAAYSTYIVADQIAGASGVLAVVALGLWFAYKGLHHVSRTVEEALHELWEFLESLANTLVFTLAGLIIAGKIYESSEASEGEALIEGRDWGYAVLLWVYLTVIRFLMFAWAIFPINARGYKLDFKECIVLGWSGLRGAVGLALGLQIYGDTALHDESFRSKQFFHIGCVAVLTILVQGSTTKKLLDILGMTMPTKEKRRWMFHVRHDMEKFTVDSLNFAKSDRIFGEPRWLDVEMLMRSNDNGFERWISEWISGVLRRLFPCLRRPKTIVGNGRWEAKKACATLSKVSRAEKLEGQRKRFLKAVKQAYVRLFKDQYLSARHIFALRVSIDADSDHLSTPLGDWKELAINHDVQWIHSWLIYFANYVPISTPPWLLWTLQDKAITALAFCNAHQIAIQHLQVLEARALEHNNETAFQADRDIEHNCTTPSIAEEVIVESSAEIINAYQFLIDLMEGWPEAMQNVKTCQLAQEVVNTKKAYITDLRKTGLLADEEAEELMSLLHPKIRPLPFQRQQNDKLLSFLQLLQENLVFADLSGHMLRQEVWPHVKLELVQANQVIQPEEANSDRIAILLRGKVDMCTAPEAHSSKTEGNAHCRALLGGGHVGSTGAVLAWSVIHETQPCPWVHVACTGCLVAYLPKALILGLIARESKVRSAVWRSLGVAMLIWQTPIGHEADYISVAGSFRNSQPCQIEKGAIFGKSATTLMLLKGEFECHAQEKEQVEIINTPGLYRMNSGSGFFKATSVMQVLIWTKSKGAQRQEKPYCPAVTHVTDLGISARQSLSSPHSLQQLRRCKWSTAADIEQGLSSDMDLDMVETILLSKQRKGLAHGLLIHQLAKRQQQETSVIA